MGTCQLLNLHAPIHVGQIAGINGYSLEKAYCKSGYAFGGYCAFPANSRKLNQSCYDNSHCKQGRWVEVRNVKKYQMGVLLTKVQVGCSSESLCAKWGVNVGGIVDNVIQIVIVPKTDLVVKDINV